jgi:hypothetical protein
MEKKMVHRLPIHFTHVAPIDYNNEVLLPKVIHGNDLPWAANQAKKAVFKGNLVRQTLFYGKRKPSLPPMTLQKDLIADDPLLEGTHDILFSPSCLTLTKYNTLKN